MLIIWDYFGVIAQDAFWYTADRLAESHGMGEQVRDAQKKADLGELSWSEYTRLVSEDIGVPVAEVREKYTRHDINLMVLSAITNLKNHRHVLLSNASAEYLLPIMKELRLTRYFERVFVSSEIGYAKPDPRAFAYVCEQMKVTPDGAVLIDDSHANIESAKNSGLSALVYAKGADVEGFIASL